MMHDIYIPTWLYRAWPWLNMAGALGYLCIGQWGVSAVLAIYAAGILYHRF